MTVDVVQQAAPAHFIDYISFLLHNRPYRLLICGEVIDQLGQWGNYIATLTLADRLGSNANGGTLVALVVVVRCLPSLFLFPAAGVVADRFPRVKVLVATNMISAVVVCGLTFVQTPATLWLMFVLLSVLFSVAAFFDPARRAMTQELVPNSQLPLAATLDAMVWSVMAACGASLGGLLVSKLGTTICFLLDGVTYLAAAVCYAAVLWQPVPSYHPAHGQPRHESLQLSEPDGGNKAVAAGMNPLHRFDSAKNCSGDMKGSMAAADAKALISSIVASGAEGPRDRRHSCDNWHSSIHVADEIGTIQLDLTKSGEGSTPGLAQDAWQQGKKDLLEGWHFVCSPHNRDVAPLMLVKASGCLLWGTSDVLYVKFTEDPRFQIRDPAFTMGILFGGMGIGALLGPVVFNRLTPPKTPQLLRSTAAAFATLTVGYVMMTAATTMPVLFPSVVVRSLGSSVLWIYSTLLLQFRVPNAIQGRVFALEMAFYVAAESASGLAGGVMFDRGHMTTRAVSAVMSIFSALGTAVWAVYAWQHRHSTSDGLSDIYGSSGVCSSDDVTHELVALRG